MARGRCAGRARNGCALPCSSSWTRSRRRRTSATSAGRDPYDKRLTTLIGELSTRSEEFRVRWAAHNVKFHRTGTKHLHHPIVGDLSLHYEALELAADPGQRLLVYQAEPGSPSHDALNLLASWITARAAEAAAEADDVC